MGIMAHIFFSVGLSGEKESDFNDTIKLTDHILRRYRNIVDIECYPPEIEPCSPRYLRPIEHGVQIYRKSFQVF